MKNVMSFKKIIGSVLLFTVLYSVPSFAQWFPYKRGYDQSQELQDIRDSEARIKARNDAKRAFDANPLNSREAYGPSQSAMRGNGNPTKELLAKKAKVGDIKFLEKFFSAIGAKITPKGSGYVVTLLNGEKVALSKLLSSTKFFTAKIPTGQLAIGLASAFTAMSAIAGSSADSQFTGVAGALDANTKAFTVPAHQDTREDAIEGIQ